MLYVVDSNSTTFVGIVLDKSSVGAVGRKILVTNLSKKDGGGVISKNNCPANPSKGLACLRALKIRR